MTNILDQQLSSPRPLSTVEVTTLRSLLMSQLIISNDNDDTKDDAENLLDYALDMINDGEDVGHVMEEVSSVLCLLICICMHYINHVCLCVGATCCVVYFIYWLFGAKRIHLVLRKRDKRHFVGGGGPLPFYWV